MNGHLRSHDNIMTAQERKEQLEFHYREILHLLGEDAEREGLIKTPDRVARAMQTLTCGYALDPIEVLTSARFSEDYDSMVMVSNIDFFSLCEHHMLPFYGKAHVAYIPDGCVCGLSKIPRVVDIFSHRLQVQERLTRQVMEAISEALHPKGVMVLMEAEHMCMQMRGVEKPHSLTTTQSFCGKFDSPDFRREFLQQIRR